MADKPEKAKDTAEVVYTPLDPGDSHETTFAGLKFRANVPVQVSRTHSIVVMDRKETTGQDGEVRTRSVEKRMPIVEVLKGNPYFKIDGVQPPRPKQAQERVPDTADEYRGYAIAWIAASTNAKAMQARWDAEASLRDRCGVAADDLRYIAPFFEERLRSCEDAKSAA